MALVEFVDGVGTAWRAWNITPEDMHPVTAREMFVGAAADFQEGWLVFESAAGDRRRLAPYPNDWSTLAPSGLQALLRRAAPVATRAAVDARSMSGEFRRFENEGVEAPSDAAGARPASAAPRSDGPRRRAEDRAR